MLSTLSKLSKLTDEQIQHYNQHGYVIVHDLLTSAEIEAFIAGEAERKTKVKTKHSFCIEIGSVKEARQSHRTTGRQTRTRLGATPPSDRHLRIAMGFWVQCDRGSSLAA